MKKKIYQGFYLTLLFISNYFDNRYLRKYKIILGTSLLMMTSACQSPKKDDSGEILCYEPSVPEYQDTVEITSRDSSDILCYQSVAEDTVVPDSRFQKPSITVVDVPEPEPIMCYEPSVPEVMCYVGIDVPDASSDEQDTTVYVIAEQMPKFPGGDSELMKYIQEHLLYPTETDADVQGRVIVRFIVEKDGLLSDIKVIRSLEPLFDKEALRVIRSMPRWEPGKQRGVNVRVQYTVPVRFTL